MKKPTPLGVGRPAFLPVAVAVLLLAAACDSSRSAPSHDLPVVLAAAKGICPSHVVYGPAPSVCRFSRVGNGASPAFNTPRRRWGVAYAFNCGSRAKDFSFVERLPGMDHMGLPATFNHARRGSGYIMISRSTMLALLRAVPRAFAVDGQLMEIDIDSVCTWHVKAVAGAPRQVAGAIPPVPPIASPWWRKKG